MIPNMTTSAPTLRGTRRRSRTSTRGTARIPITVAITSGTVSPEIVANAEYTIAATTTIPISSQAVRPHRSRVEVPARTDGRCGRT